MTATRSDGGTLSIEEAALGEVGEEEGGDGGDKLFA